MRFSEICEILSDAGIENPRNEAEIFIEELLGERTVNGDRDYCSDALANAIERRCADIPCSTLSENGGLQDAFLRSMRTALFRGPILRRWWRRQ